MLRILWLLLSRLLWRKWKVSTWNNNWRFVTVLAQPLLVVLPSVQTSSLKLSRLPTVILKIPKTCYENASGQTFVIPVSLRSKMIGQSTLSYEKCDKQIKYFLLWHQENSLARLIIYWSYSPNEAEQHTILLIRNVLLSNEESFCCFFYLK